MPISDKKAKELAELDPPKSLDRIVRFTSDLGERLRSRGASEFATPSAAPGELAERAQGMASSIVEKNASIVGGLSARDFQVAARKHAVTGAEIQDFARWLARWQEKRKETESVSAPTMLFVQGAAAVELPGDESSTLARLAGKRGVRRVVEDEEVVEVVERRVRPRTVTRVEEEEEPRTWAEARQPRLEHRPPAEKAKAPEESVVERPEREAPRPLYRRALGAVGRSVWTSNVGLAGFMLGALAGRQVEAALGSPFGPSPMASIATMRLADPTISGAMLGRPPFVSGPWLGEGATAHASFLPPGALPPSELSRIHGASPMPFLAGQAAVSAGQAVAPPLGTLGPELILRRDALEGGIVLARLPTGGPLFLPGSVAAALRAQFSMPPRLTARGGATPLMGQVTVVAPPIRVASREMELGGSALAFDWKKIGLGVGPLDAAGWSAMRQALPPGSQVFYPALPQGSLGPNAVNLRLSQPLLSDLMTRAYGPSAAGLAGSASFAAAGAAMAAPAAIPLSASIVPLERPKGQVAGVLGETVPGDTVGMAGGAQARRGGAFEFLGVPVRVAPSLAGSAELKEEQAARKGMATGPQAPPLKPQEFAALRARALSRFQTVEAEPDKAAWRKAAPAHGLKGDKPTDVLSPTARIKPPAPSESLPQLEGGAGPVAKAVRALESAPSEADFGRSIWGAQRGEPAAPGEARGFASPRTGPRSEPQWAGALQPSFGVRGWSPGGLASLHIPVAPSIGTAGARASAMPIGYRSLPAMPSVSVAPPLSPPAIPGMTPIKPGLGPTAETAPAPVATLPPALPGVAVPDQSGAGAPPGPAQVGGASPALTAAPRPLGFGTPSEHVGGAPPIPRGVPRELPKPPETPRFIGPIAPVGQGAISGGGASPKLFEPIEAPTLGLRAGAPVKPPTPPDLSLPQLGGGASIGRATSTISSVPQRLLPHLPALASRPQASGLAIQRSRSGESPSAPSGAGGRPGGSTAGRTASGAEGADTAQVHLLANEVWALLKRRLLDEKNRMGKW